VRVGAALLAVSLGILCLNSFPQSSNKKEHPGAVVDAYRRTGLEADAYAYGSQTTNGGTSCPTYPDPLDSQRSASSTGNFVFRIDSSKSSFLAVYCKPGFAARTETANDNSTDRTRVRPDPVTLYPISLAGGTRAQVATFAIGVDVKRLQADFVYYANSNPKAFTEGTAKLSQRDRSVVRELMESGSFSGIERLPEGGQPTRSIESSTVAYTAITRDLDQARSNLIYYAQADPEGYNEALQQSFQHQSAAIEAIRTRPSPFGVER
jgi:hypothetical protein